MRVFVALDLDERAREAIRAEQRRLGARLGNGPSSPRWVKPEQIHLTLAFVGEISDALVSRALDSLSRPIAEPPFTAVFDRLGVFPARGEPRVLWLGVGGGADRVSRIAREVASRLSALAIPLEDRPYHPHVTLARFRTARRSHVERAIAGGEGREIARVAIDHLTVYQSQLSSSGPAYTALLRATLT